MREELARLRTAAEREIADADGEEALDALRVRYLGRKGSLSGILRGLGQLDAADRPAMGALANDVKDAISATLDARGLALSTARLDRALAEERIDVTLPGRRRPRGHVHPLRQVEDDIVDIFVAMGFHVADGPEIEDDFHNFGALNFPPDHPARDAQDTFFLAGDGEERLLRTHTSPVQIRVLQSAPAPLRIVAPGACYRRDDLDATHSPMFQQIEVFMVDERVTFADLKGVLTEFARRLFGAKTGVRFRASFFPFVEPGAEVDVSCMRCTAASSVDPACRVCKGSGWLEILGAGMIHPNVLRACGHDPERVRGFAFGMGVDRVAQLRHGVEELRAFYDNDVRFLAQF